MMRCAIWYQLYSLKNVKNAHGGVLLLVKLQAKSRLNVTTLLHGCFLRFLNCTNGTKLRKTSHILFATWELFRFKFWSIFKMSSWENIWCTITLCNPIVLSNPTPIALCKLLLLLFIIHQPISPCNLFC